MGEKVLMYYKYIGDTSGLPGKMELAKATKVPSSQAAVCADTPEVLAQFRSAVEQITGKPAPKY